MGFPLLSLSFGQIPTQRNIGRPWDINQLRDWSLDLPEGFVSPRAPILPSCRLCQLPSGSPHPPASQCITTTPFIHSIASSGSGCSTPGAILSWLESGVLCIQSTETLQPGVWGRLQPPSEPDSPFLRRITLIRFSKESNPSPSSYSSPSKTAE